MRIRFKIFKTNLTMIQNVILKICTEINLYCFVLDSERKEECIDFTILCVILLLLCLSTRVQRIGMVGSFTPKKKVSGRKLGVKLISEIFSIKKKTWENPATKLEKILCTLYMLHFGEYRDKYRLYIDYTSIQV